MDPSFDIPTDDRERVLSRAEQDKAFAAVGRILSGLVDSTGLPEDEIANTLLEADDLVLAAMLENLTK